MNYYTMLEENKSEVVPEQNIQESIEAIPQSIEAISQPTEAIPQSIEAIPQQSEPIRKRYSAIFYVKYHTSEYPRPSEEVITEYFSQYGVVDHLRYPENRKHALVFMTSLKSNTETVPLAKDVINCIFESMQVDKKFHVGFARKQRPQNAVNAKRLGQKPNYKQNNRPANIREIPINTRERKYNNGYVPQLNRVNGGSAPRAVHRNQNSQQESLNQNENPIYNSYVPRNRNPQYYPQNNYRRRNYDYYGPRRYYFNPYVYHGGYDQYRNYYRERNNHNNRARPYDRSAENNQSMPYDRSVDNNRSRPYDRSVENNQSRPYDRSADNTTRTEQQTKTFRTQKRRHVLSEEVRPDNL